MATRGRFVLRDGKWEEGKAAPEQIPEHLRGLPGEWVTKDDANPDKIHALDPPHIVGALVEDRVKELIPEEGPKDASQAAKKLKCAQPGEVVPLSQWEIDVVRMRVLHSLVTSAVREKQMGGKPNVREIQHLRFETNNVNDYALCAGNPPADADRLPHERGFQLALDVFCWPERIVELLKAKGIEPPDVETLLACATPESRIIQ